MSPIGVGTLIKVLEAGIDIFAEDGLFAAGTLAIAKKAEVAESTIFRKFETKENLFLECFRTAISRSLDPAQFHALLFEKAEKQEFASVVMAAVKRWYSSLPVTAARLLLFTSLSSSEQWRRLGSERINQIVAALAERIEMEGRKQHARNLDAHAAATSLISSLLYLKSTRSGAKDREQRTAETFIRQWMFGLFPA